LAIVSPSEVTEPYPYVYVQEEFPSQLTPARPNPDLVAVLEPGVMKDAVRGMRPHSWRVRLGLAVTPAWQHFAMDYLVAS
jgi:hypothetical protein